MLIRATFAMGLALLTIACDPFDTCANDPIIEIPSTDGSVSAWIFVRDCGATTSWSTQVSILKKGKGPPVDGGNAFVIDRKSQVIATWHEPNHVTIAFERTGHIFVQESNVAGVSISYEQN
jgi:hypothetical protein